MTKLFVLQQLQKNEKGQVDNLTLCECPWYDFKSCVTDLPARYVFLMDMGYVDIFNVILQIYLQSLRFFMNLVVTFT